MAFRARPAASYHYSTLQPGAREGWTSTKLLITPHERLSEHGEDDEVHNRAMDTSARPRVSCLSSPPSRIFAAAEEAVKYSLVSVIQAPANCEEQSSA